MKKIIFSLCLLMTLNAFSQDNYWTQKNINSIPQEDLINYETQVSKYSIYQLDEIQIINALANAPLRSESNSSNVLINMPYAEDKFGIFEFYEVQTLAPELANNYSSIKSYVGKARGQNSDRVRITITPTGLYAKIFSNNGSVYIEPLTNSDSFYVVFKTINATFSSVQCDFEEQIENQNISNNSDGNEANLVDDSTLRTFRLAVTATAEYSLYHISQAGLNSGTDLEKKTAVLAAITVVVDRAIGVLENDLAVSLQLVPNNDSLIFLDSATDPFTNANTNPSNGTYLNEVNAFLPGAIGDSNYDIGHLLTNRGGGVAFRGSICNNAIKAGAVSGNPQPVGYGIENTFLHETGHQLGAFHSFNNECGGNRSDNSVYEAGGGVTIMSYGNASNGCPPNIQGFRYFYYHAASLLQMVNTLDNISCAQTSTISNNPPSIVPQSDYLIPRRTPFILDTEATDSDNDILTYNWEQFDNEISTQPPSSVSIDGPLFRNFEPNTASLRYFPKMETLLNNQLQTTWEVLPNVSRNMNYVVTVRDNNINGGQNVQDLVSIGVESAAGPFELTSQNTPGIVWDVGDIVTITWNVAGTDANGINASEVDFILSTDGGNTFDEVLLANTPNDGSQDVTVPADFACTDCRLMVKASDNIFFALNEEFFTVNIVCNDDSNNNSVSIPDGVGTKFDPSPGTPAESIINVPEDNIVKSVTVNLQLTHPNLTNIDVELESPGGEIVQLWSKDLCNSGGMDISFRDGAQELPSDNCGSIVSGEYEPVELLGNFIDGNTLGDWTLRATDFVTNNTGTIDSWSMEICSAVTLNTEEFSSEIFTLFPNPTRDYVILSFNQPTSFEKQIQLFDVSGRLIKSESLSESLSSHQLNVSELSSGIYFVKVNQNNAETIKKLIIK